MKKHLGIASLSAVAAATLLSSVAYATVAAYWVDGSEGFVVIMNDAGKDLSIDMTESFDVYIYDEEQCVPFSGVLPLDNTTTESYTGLLSCHIISSGVFPVFYYPVPPAFTTDYDDEVIGVIWNSFGLEATDSLCDPNNDFIYPAASSDRGHEVTPTITQPDAFSVDGEIPLHGLGLQNQIRVLTRCSPS